MVLSCLLRAGFMAVWQSLITTSRRVYAWGNHTLQLPFSNILIFSFELVLCKMVHGACAWGLKPWFASGPTFHSLPGIDSQLSIPLTPGTPAGAASLPNPAVRCCLPPLPARVEKVGCTHPRAYWEGTEATTGHWADSAPEYLAGDWPEKKKKAAFWWEWASVTCIWVPSIAGTQV